MVLKRFIQRLMKCLKDPEVDIIYFNASQYAYQFSSQGTRSKLTSLREKSITPNGEGPAEAVNNRRK